MSSTPAPGKHTPPSEPGHSPFPRSHLLLRAVWNMTWLLLASWTPPQMRAWRVFLLRLFGAKIGKYADVRGSARVWYPPNLEMADHTTIAGGVQCYNMDRIILHARTVVSQRSFLCGGTHDIRAPSPYLPLVTRPIEIGPDAWIAAEAFIGPGCQVPAGCVIGARAVVFKGLEPWSVYAGNPARKVSSRPQQPPLISA